MEARDCLRLAFEMLLLRLSARGTNEASGFTATRDFHHQSNPKVAAKSA
jgi:hypothetical protein